MKHISLIIYTSFWFTSFTQGQVPVLWGITIHPSTTGVASIFKINGDGTGMHSQTYSTGDEAQGMFIKANNGIFYGTSGILTGEIYGFNPMNNNYAFTNLGSGSIPPTGSLMQANNGLLYGLTGTGGTTNDGMLYSFDVNSNLYEQLYSFQFPYNNPRGFLTQANNGKLYGITASYILFSIDTGGGNFTPAFVFVDSLGRYPGAFLILANDGKLYGTATEGGANGVGTIFSFDPSNNNFSKIYDFDNTNGADPGSKLIQANNNKLYGVAGGGVNGGGVIFSFDIATNSYTKVFDATTLQGVGSLLQASDNNLYGTCGGGAYGQGAVFKFDIINGGYTDIYDFKTSDSVGINPIGGLLEDNIITDIAAIGDNQMTIFPNPSNGGVYFNGLQDGYNIEVYNPLGEIICTSKTFGGNYRLSLTGRANGIYFYRITDNTAIIQQGKIVLE